MNGWFGRHLGAVVSVCLSEETYFQQTSEVAAFGIKFTFAFNEKLPPHTFISQSIRFAFASKEKLSSHNFYITVKGRGIFLILQYLGSYILEGPYIAD